MLTACVRYACDTVGAVLMVGVAAAAVFAFVKLPRVPRASPLWIIVLAPLLVRPLSLPTFIYNPFDTHASFCLYRPSWAYTA